MGRSSYSSSMYFKYLGYNSYEAYLLGPEWAHTKRRYMKSLFTRKKCFVCGSRRFVLHHETYANLGWENIRKDLVPLCGKHHDEVHFDEMGEKIPLKPGHLRERRLQLRRNHVRRYWLHGRWLWGGLKLTYRLFF